MPFSDSVSRSQTTLQIPLQYRQFLESLPVAASVCDVAGRLIAFNEAAVVLWGRRPEAGKEHWTGAWKLFNLDGSPLALEHTALALTLKRGVAVAGNEVILERPGGERHHVISHPQLLRDENGLVVGALDVLVDVTEHIQYQLLKKQTDELSRMYEALKISEDRYHRMVTEVEDYVIILLDVNGYIQNWNKGAQKIKGYLPDEVLGRHFNIFYSDEDIRNDMPDRLMKKAAQEGKAVHEGWRLRKDGSRFWGSVVLTALHNPEGDVVGFTKVTRDLTDKKVAEEQLLATSRKLEEQNRELERMNEELSSFAYISSHDLQEPLRKIQTFSDRIVEMEYDRLSEKGKDYFRRMQAGASRMQKLIRDILAYSRTSTQEKKLEDCDLNLILHQSKTELEVPINQKKAIIESESLPILKGIPFQLQQLFDNLLNNALKFSKAGVTPHVTIRSRIVKGETVPPGPGPRSDRYHHIAVADNGVGFEPEYKRKIFEVFQRLHPRNEYGGTGIGLAICKKIVENHFGFIDAESTPNEGAVFHLFFPVTEEQSD